MTWTLIAAVLVAVGTVVQAVSSFREWAEEKSEIVSDALEVYDFRQEYRWWRHPVKRWKNRRTVRDLLRGDSRELVAYRRLRVTVWGWSTIGTGSVFGVLAIIVDPLWPSWAE